MHAKLFRPHQCFSNPMSVIISILLLSLFIPRNNAKNDSKLYKDCSKINTKPCGKHIEWRLEYPFWGENIRPRDCGLEGFELSCEESDLVVEIGSNNKYHVVDVDLSTSVLKLKHYDNPLEHICDISFSPVPGTMLNENLYSYRDNTEDIYLLKFSDEPPKTLTKYDFSTCPNDNYNHIYFVQKDSFVQAQKDLHTCTYTRLLVHKSVLEEFIKNPTPLLPQKLFDGIFEVYYNTVNLYVCIECVQAPRRGLCWSGTYLGTNDQCLYRQSDTMLKDNIYEYVENTEVLYLLYNCGYEPPKPLIVHNSKRTDGKHVYFLRKNSFLKAETKTKVPVDSTVLEEFITNPLQGLFHRSFKVYYNRINQKACTECVNYGGLCWIGTDSKSNDTCLYQSGHKKNVGLIIGIGGALGGTILVLSVLIIYCCRKKTKHGSFLFSQNVSSHHKDVDAFMKQYGSTIPQRYRYSTIKRITNSFKDELGKGGYGNVYRGSLPDGRDVAVKVLNASKGNGEEFINEVASIGRTSHVNVVTLLGFCYEGERRALIYEFMPNGSLEKFIYGTTPLLEGKHLGWEKLFNIAIGIARGLEYLHQGCNTRILHFDIKPHNILLDKDFRPKISDFGLAKLYARNESVISSLLQARGTIGYIAPELTNRNFGQVSHKSDVYSYGMMILEMVGGRKNVNARADHTSEIYYPRWLYKRIQFGDVPNFTNETSEEENKLARKMVIVGLWCIQIYPSQRPSISKVIEMLEVQTGSLEIPPSPYLCSVPGSPSNSKSKLVLLPPSETEPTSST